MNPNAIFTGNDNVPCSPCGSTPSACDILHKNRAMLMDAQSAVNFILDTVLGDNQRNDDKSCEPGSMMEDLNMQSDLLFDVITKLQQLRSVLCGQ